MPFAGELHQRQQQRRRIGRRQGALELFASFRSFLSGIQHFCIHGCCHQDFALTKAKRKAVCIGLTSPELARQMHPS
jgi:hypothetical protein